MQVEVQKSSKEVKTRLFLPHVAIADRFIHEPFGL